MLKLVIDTALISDSQFIVQNNTSLTFFTFTYSLHSGQWIKKLNDNINITSSASARVMLTQRPK